MRFTVEAQISKTRFWSELREQFPLLTPTQSKAINKLYDVGPEDFANGISSEKHVSLCRVSRATAHRELTALCEMGGVGADGGGAGDAVLAVPPVIKPFFAIPERSGAFKVIQINFLQNIGRRLRNTNVKVNHQTRQTLTVDQNNFGINVFNVDLGILGIH